MRTINTKLLVWSCLAMIADGYDSAGLASAAPALAESWHVARTAFGPAFSASLFGILIGAPLLGHAGDRYGRKPLIITGCLLFSLATLATVGATSLEQVMLLRVCTGIGLGGLMPNVIALNAEAAPRRFRATLIVLMFTGISLGAGIPGIVQASLIPHYGWQVMFWLGGLIPLLITACLFFTLPESVHRDANSGAPAETTRALFQGPLALITPLLWMCFAAALMANFFLNSWLPLVLDGSGLTAQQTGITTSLYHYAGVLGGILVSLLLNRLGFAAIAGAFLFAVPAIAGIGVIGTAGNAFSPAGPTVAIAGLCTLGAQFGNIAASGLLYPTAIRSRGVGWALGIGRFGSIAGPLVGGRLLALNLPTQQLFLAASLPMIAGAAAAGCIALSRYRKLGHTRLEEIATGAAAL
jgi:AAHS family 4-hydroxybenzoate transporter-like MFS transporter